VIEHRHDMLGYISPCLWHTLNDTCPSLCC